MNILKILRIIAGTLAVTFLVVAGYFFFNKAENYKPRDIFMSRYSNFDNVLKKPIAEKQPNEIFEDLDFNILATRDFISKDSWKRIFISTSIQHFLFEGMFTSALFDDNTRTDLSQTNAGEEKIGYPNVILINSSTIGVSSTEPESILSYTRLVREDGVWKFDFSDLFSVDDYDVQLFNKLKDPVVNDFLDWLYVADSKQVESFKNDLLVINVNYNSEVDHYLKLKTYELNSLAALSSQLQHVVKNDKLWTLLSMNKGDLSQGNTNSVNNKTIKKVTKNQQPADIFIERYRAAYKSLQSSKKDPDYVILRNNSINSRSFISMSSWQALFLLNQLQNLLTKESDKFQLYFDTDMAHEIEKVFKESADQGNFAKYEGQDKIVLHLSDQGKFIWMISGLQLVYESNTWKFNVVNDKNPFFSYWFQHPRLVDLQKKPFRDFMEWLYTADEESITILEKSIKNVWNGIQDPGQELFLLAAVLADERYSIRVMSEESFVINNVLLLRKGKYWVMSTMPDR